jgi:hypothetical protein
MMPPLELLQVSRYIRYMKTRLISNYRLQATGASSEHHRHHHERLRLGFNESSRTAEIAVQALQSRVWGTSAYLFR